MVVSSGDSSRKVVVVASVGSSGSSSCGMKRGGAIESILVAGKMVEMSNNGFIDNSLPQLL